MHNTKRYTVLLEGVTIGTTALEKADAPMGVVFGKIDFVSIESAYEFFKNYCLENNIGFDDSPEVKCILTRNIPRLVVGADSGVEIKGLGCSISGMESDWFEVCVEGVPYPFYQEEFPHHVQAYNNSFNPR